MRKILQRRPKEKKKPEEIIPEQGDKGNHLSVHGPSTNTGPEIKSRGIVIIIGFTPVQDRPPEVTAVCEMFGGTIHIQCRSKRTRGAYP